MRSRAVLISNIPAPYREPVYEIVANSLNQDFSVVYCKNIESDRMWKFKEGRYPRFYLPGKEFVYNNIYEHHVHWNTGVWTTLKQLNPNIVITNGYNPTHLSAFLWAWFRNRDHIAMTDGWLKSEEHLSFIHRWLRKSILSRTKAFVGASRRSLELFQAYGAHPNSCFVSQLCANNEAFDEAPNVARKYDLMFSGQMISRKMPLFFCDIAKSLKERRGSLNVLIIGDGPLREAMLNRLKCDGVTYDYPGFISQEDLPQFYKSSKLLLFPTLQECWGVVVNEACAAGTPVVTCSNTAVDSELVIHNQTGIIAPLEVERWVEEVDRLLSHPENLEMMSNMAKEKVASYTYRAAADGIIRAISFVEKFRSSVS